jgi:N-hydroxyarylamine O-acetyltransferase
MPLDVDRYLDRIAYAGARRPVIDTLCGLHVAHLRAVPFENLSIHLREPIRLELDALEDKIVARRRGGFCYELNGLFAALLEALGFTVSRLAARVYGPGGALGIPFDHLALAVELDEPWLVDVGFGDSFSYPLRLLEAGEQRDGGRRYRLDRDGDLCTLHERRGDADPQRLYQVSLTPHSLSAFADGCRYHQTSPDSPFTRRRICSVETPGGRVTVSDRRLLFTTDHGTRVEHELPDDAAAREAIERYFGIVVPA